MAARQPNADRVRLFSDGVFAVLITILVLELKPPHEETFSALLPLWPTGLSYAVSYLFIAIVWVNHHHLFNFAELATQRLVWFNFAHLFSVSLVPFATVWIAETRLAAAPGSPVCGRVRPRQRHLSRAVGYLRPDVPVPSKNEDTA